MEEKVHQTSKALELVGDDDSADEYVVIHDADESDKCSTTSETTEPSSSNRAVDAESAVHSLGTVADIGKGLDGDKMTASSVSHSESLSQKLINSSIFGSFGVEDQFREMIRSENEQSRADIEEIKFALSELAKQKSNNNELTDLISRQKASLVELQQKLDLTKVALDETQDKLIRSEEQSAKKDCENKDLVIMISDLCARLTLLEQDLKQTQQELDLSKNCNEEKNTKIEQLEETIRQLTQEINESNGSSAKSKEEMANKDEIINVLREEITEQQRVHETRVKMWRERMDQLERMLIKQQERVEAEKEQFKSNGELAANKEMHKPLFFICENCLNAFPRYGYLYAHCKSSDCNQ